MANVKISQLPTASAVTSDDFVAMVDSGSLATQQASFEKVLNYVTSSTFDTLTVTNLQGTSADFTSLTGSLQGNASSATNATAVNTVFNNDNAVKYVPFVDTNGNQELKIDSGITYVPLSDSLIVNGNTTVAGNIGIGTTTPNTTLVVQTNGSDLINLSAAPNATLQFGSLSSTPTPGFAARQTNTGVSGLWHIAATPDNSTAPLGDMVFDVRENNNSDFGTTVGKIAFSFTRFSNQLMTITRDGKVGIGTINPSEKLEVVGDSIFSGSVEVSGTLRADVEVSGNITAASYTLSAADYGKTLLFSSSATQDITCSSGLDVGYNVTVVQAGTGQLNFSGSGVTLVNRFAHTSSAGQYSAVSVIVLNGTQYLVVGDTA